MIRKKSHDLFQQSQTGTEASFAKSVEIVLNRAFPDEKFTKEILIDDDTMIKIKTETRIELLRIIQESVTNILKHARASAVSVLIYEERGLLNLSIKDDGRGFDAKLKPKGFGMFSIKSRVQSLDGDFDIITGNTGTEVNVKIPLEPAIA
jgi:signal transduction histidine kinase